MANYSYMLLGSNDQVNKHRNRKDSDFKEFAAGRYCIPLLWLAAGRADEVVCIGEEDEVYVGFGCPTADGIARFDSGHAVLASMVHGEANLQPWAKAMNDFLRTRSDDRIEFDLSEIALMDDPHQMAEEIREFLSAIESGQFTAPAKKQSGLFGWFTRGRNPLADFRIRLSLDADLLKSGPKLLADRNPRAFAGLVGGGWNDDFDRYFVGASKRDE